MGKKGKKKDAENTEHIDKGNQDSYEKTEQVEEEIREVTPEEVTTETPSTEEKYQQLEDKYVRLVAEFDNYKKRTAKEYGELIKTANRDLLLQLLPILDHLGMAIESDTGDNNTEALQKGLQLIQRDMENFLEKMGVTEIESVGKIFDPNVHEAMMQLPSEDYDEGIVMDQSQKGYMLRDKVLRPAKVIISTGSSTDNTEEQGE
ncbi:MAG: nucleotide exchange factor GrpE [candidate division Zixibacteria bacterium]|nr:nucleotide exchange factor GrpE [candidate division Zixibacteria bacterium]